MLAPADCVVQVRIAPPFEKEGLFVTHDKGLRHALIALAYMFLNPNLVTRLVDFGATELVVEVLRKVTGEIRHALHSESVCSNRCSS